MQTKTEILIEATQRLAESIDSIDGVANAVIFEAAQRLQELKSANESATASLVLARNERDEARAEVDAIRNVISDAGFSDVLDPLQRVTRLIQERDEAISERTPHDYGILRDQRDDYRERLGASIKETQEARAEVKRLEIINKEVLQANYTMGTTCPEPSRLEIAAIILTGSYGNAGSYQDLAKIGLKQADALIAAAREVTK